MLRAWRLVRPLKWDTVQIPLAIEETMAAIVHKMTLILPITGQNMVGAPSESSRLYLENPDYNF